MFAPDLADLHARAAPKLAALEKLVRGKKTLLAQTHDFPDPDSIASALALKWILEQLTHIETTVGYGGIIGRAENRAMCRQLNIKMKRTTPADLKKYDLVALLDTQPEAGNHSIPIEFTPHIVFDHHFPRDLQGGTPEFFDVGGEYGATSTMLTELIIGAGLTPPTDLATALYYGIKSDTLNLGRDTCPIDVAAYLYLFPLIDNRALSEIESPQVPMDYFRVLGKAIARAKLYGTMVVSDLGELYTPDLCSEVADSLMRMQGVNHALSVGWYEEGLFLSLRTRSRAKNAGKILHSIVAGQGLGTAGGHGPMAGARLPVHGRSQRARADLRRKVVNAVVKAFGQDYRHFVRVVTRKDTSPAIDPPPPKDPPRRDTQDLPRRGKSPSEPPRPRAKRNTPPERATSRDEDLEATLVDAKSPLRGR